MVAGGNDKLAGRHCKHAQLTPAVRRQTPLKAQKAALIAWLPVVRVDDLVKDRRPPISAFTRVFDALWAAALRAVLDKIINANNSASSDQDRNPTRRCGMSRHAPRPWQAPPAHYSRRTKSRVGGQASGWGTMSGKLFAVAATAALACLAPSAPAAAADFVMKMGCATMNEGQHQFLKFYK